MSHLAAKRELDRLRAGAAAAITAPTQSAETPHAAQPAEDTSPEFTAPRLAVAAGRFDFLKFLPSWLASAVVHAVLLIVLGWVAIDEVATSKVAGLEVGMVRLEETPRLDDTSLPMVVADHPSSPGKTELTEVLAPRAAAPVPRTSGAPVELAIGQLPHVPSLLDEVGLELGSGQELSGVVEAQGAGSETPLVGNGYASFYGAEAKGYRFVYIVDASRSMLGPRFNKACMELMNSIIGLDEHQSFYVIFFNTTDYPQFWPNVENVLAPRKTETLDQLGAWMRQVIPYGSTYPDSALRRALELKPDAIFLLSDGEFNQGSALSVIRRSPHKVVIHTVALESPIGEPMLQEIARRTYGTYRFVP